MHEPSRLASAPLDLARIRSRLAATQPRVLGTAPRAAVAAVLRESTTGPPEVLLIRRAEHPTDPWSGHMAFPGGRLDDVDASLEHTAIRETREELGLDLVEHGDLLAQLDDVPTHKSGLVVRPFVWVLRGSPALAPNAEVDEVHWVELASLARGERDTTYRFDWKGASHEVPAYDVSGRIVWGLTYRMLQIFFEHVRG